MERRKAERGGELAARPEALRLNDRSSQGRCRDHADARDGGQTLRQLVGSVPGQKLLLQTGELELNSADLIGQSLYHQPSQWRHLGDLVGGKPSRQPQGMVQATRHFDAELRQETTPPVPK